MLHDIAPHAFHNEYQPQLLPQADSRILFYQGKEVLVGQAQGERIFPTLADLEAYNVGLAERCRYLFAVDDVHYFLADSLTIPADESYVMQNIQGFRRDYPGYQDLAGATGWQIYNWYQSRRFCGRCGTEMVHSEQERMVRCPKCGQIEYPKICPAVIIGITDGDRILMSPYTDHNNRPNFALFAGFTEIGESIEQTVQREVMEEVGLHVKNIRFYRSQPWAFTDTLMLGFYCDLDGSDQVKVDHKEIDWARWFPREEIDVENDGLSLTNEMIVYFKENEKV